MFISINLKYSVRISGIYNNYFNRLQYNKKMETNKTVVAVNFSCYY